MATDPNRHDRFVMRQRIRPVINQYEISLPGADGEPGEPVCFVEQARFKFKEDVYDIDVSGDTGHAVDRRLVLANAVGMDALQAR